MNTNFLLSAIAVIICILSQTKAYAQQMFVLPSDTDEHAELTVYSPAADNNTGMAVLVCPGGGYVWLAIDNEGTKIAEWLAANGITGAVLKYRLPAGKHTVPATDVRNALRLIRAKSDSLGINPEKVGIAGSSAGGHLASTVCTHIIDSLSRPDFAILFYPVITSDPTFTHQGSMDALLGDKVKDAEMLHLYSNELQVSPDTPPTLLLLSSDDTLVPSSNSVVYYNALIKNKVPVSMHIFPTGNHGWGFNPNFAYHNQVKELMLKWMQWIDRK